MMANYGYNTERECKNVAVTELNNNTETVDSHEYVDDPQILVAKIASLKDSTLHAGLNDHLDYNSSQHDESINANDEQVVEITKMDLKVDDFNNEVLDHFTKEAANNTRRSSKGSTTKEVYVVKKIRQDLTIKEKKRKRSPIKVPATDVNLGSVKKDKAEVKEGSSEFGSDEKDCDSQKANPDYKPGKDESLVMTRKSRSKKVKKDDIWFTCNHCLFKSEILGMLKIHKHNKHEDKVPSYLDMAEASIYNLGEGSGLTNLSILKEVLYENFDNIVEDKSGASKLLGKALKEGVKLGRLKVSRRGKGRGKYMLVTKLKKIGMVEKWRNCEDSVELVDSVGKAKLDKSKRNISVKNRASAIKYRSSVKNDSDSDINVIEECLTDKTKLRLIRKNLSIKPNLTPNHVTNFILSTVPPPLPTPDSDKDDSSQLLTCPVCFISYWYEHQTLQHIHAEHPGHQQGEKTMKLESNQKKKEKFGEILDSSAKVSDIQVESNRSSDDRADSITRVSEFQQDKTGVTDFQANRNTVSEFEDDKVSDIQLDSNAVFDIKSDSTIVSDCEDELNSVSDVQSDNNMVSEVQVTSSKLCSDKGIRNSNLQIQSVRCRSSLKSKQTIT